MPKHEIRNILLNNLEKKQSGNKIWPVYVILQNNFFYKKLYEKCGLETSPRPFLIFTESPVKRILRRTACCFGQILIAFLLPIEVVLNSLQTQKGLKLVFRPQFDINWSNFINKQCLFPKLFSKMYCFMLRHFADVMRFEIVEF